MTGPQIWGFGQILPRCISLGLVCPGSSVQCRTAPFCCPMNTPSPSDVRLAISPCSLDHAVYSLLAFAVPQSRDQGHGCDLHPVISFTMFQRCQRQCRSGLHPTHSGLCERLSALEARSRHAKARSRTRSSYYPIIMQRELSNVASNGGDLDISGTVVQNS